MTETETGFQVSGDGPAAYESSVGIFMAPFVDAVCQAVALRSGESVLDVACGTGFLTRRLPELVGSGGRVVGADVNPGMLARAQQSCPAGISWVQGLAAAMPLPDNDFDVVVCQQGAQFFPDLTAAMTEARRVGRPGLRYAATIWAPMEHSPYLQAQVRSLAAEVGEEAIGSLRAAIPPDGDRLLGDGARAAGFVDVSVTMIVADVVLPSIADYYPMQIMATPWGEPFSALPEPARDRVIQDAVDLLADYRQDDGRYRVPFASQLLLARD